MRGGDDGSSDLDDHRRPATVPVPVPVPSATAGEVQRGNEAKTKNKRKIRVVYSPYPGRGRGVTAADAAAGLALAVAVVDGDGGGGGGGFDGEGGGVPSSSLVPADDDDDDGDGVDGDGRIAAEAGGSRTPFAERAAVAAEGEGAAVVVVVAAIGGPDTSTAGDDDHVPPPSHSAEFVAVDELDLSESYAVTDAGLLGRHVASFLSISEALEDPDVTDSEDGVEMTYRYHLTGPENFWGALGGVGGGAAAAAAMDAANAEALSSSPIPPFVGVRGADDEVAAVASGGGAGVGGGGSEGNDRCRFCACGGARKIAGEGRGEDIEDYFSDGDDEGEDGDEDESSVHDRGGRGDGGGAAACCAQSKSQSSKESDDNTPPDVAPVTPPDASAAIPANRRPRHRDRHHREHHHHQTRPAASARHRIDAGNLRRERKRELQRHIGQAVLSNPVPVRSYCLSAGAKARRLRLTERQHRQRLFLMSSTSSSGNNRRPRGRRSRGGGGGGGGGGGDCAYCRRRRRGAARSPSPPRSPSSSRSASPSPRFRAAESSFNPLRPVLNRIMENVALSVFLQIADGAADTSICVCLSAYKISSGAVHLVVSTTFEATGGVWNTAVSAVVAQRHRLLNPWAAADFATEVLASGIQSVAEGVGSTRKGASAAIQHYLAGHHHHHSKNKSAAHGAAHHHGHGAAGGKVGGVGGKNVSSRSAAASFFGFVKMSGRRVQNVNNAISDKLFRRLSRVDSTSRVISYTEMADEVLTQQAKQRVQRMMHYDVSLKPFVATVMAPPSRQPPPQGDDGEWGGGGGAGNNNAAKRSPRPPRRVQQPMTTREQQRGASAGIAAGAVAPETFSNFDLMGASSSSLTEMERVHPGGGGGGGGGQLLGDEVGRAALRTSPTAAIPGGGGAGGASDDDDGDDDSSYMSSSSESSSTITSNSSPFMCTPKSFPPSPSSRSLVMARGTRFAEDVVFLARDQLRVEGGLASTNDRTRSVAMSLREGRRLAVFSAEDAGSGIALTCGQHCATKVGTSLYCSTRCMVPVLRNCHVYFEMSVSTPSGNILHHASTMSSLAIGLSTLEMTHNTLVGAWKSSVGLCTTGQILSAGQWFSPNDPRFSAYGSNSTVGCLVRIDDDSAIETWDGVMLTASVTFNVDGKLVVPPVCVAPVGVGSGSVLAAMGAYNGAGGAGGRGGFAVGMGGGAGELLSAGMPSASLPLFVPREEELFPTLTLHSPGTYVMCRFCAQDILAKTRESIGAPKGVTVYAVDGSILFEEDVDRRRYSTSSSSSSSGGGENADGDKDISPVDSAATENDISPVDSLADQSEATGSASARASC